MPSDITETHKTVLAEDRHIERRLARFTKDRYFWYIAVLVVSAAFFIYAPNLFAVVGFNFSESYELGYYVALYRFLFLLSVAIASWRFGMKGGLTVCFALAPIVLSVIIVNLWGPNTSLEIGLLAVGIVFSWLIGKQGEMKRLLERKNDDLRQQATRLSLEIDQRKLAEEEIRHAAEEWRTTFDSITDLISIHSIDNRIVRMNRAFADAFKSTPKELLGKTCYELVHGTKEPLPNCPHQQTLKTGKSAMAEFFEPSLEMHLQVATSPILDPKGELAGSVHITRDVTERKRMDEQLIMTDRLASIGELASGIAHELNNPLTSVIGFSQLLMEGNIPDEIKEDLGIVCSEAQRASNIVKNLLTFARKHAPVKQLSRVNTIIEDVLRLRAYEQKVSNIEVKEQLATDLPEIMVDYFQLQQVFLNIIVNAENAMLEAHGRGKLVITTERVNHVVRTSFVDNGPGITKENLSRIFAPFFTTKEVGKGTGLGLSICHGIVSAHGGQIYAKSEHGKGATFIVELPINGR